MRSLPTKARKRLTDLLADRLASRVRDGDASFYVTGTFAPPPGAAGGCPGTAWDLTQPPLQRPTQHGGCVPWMAAPLAHRQGLNCVRRQLTVTPQARQQARQQARRQGPPQAIPVPPAPPNAAAAAGRLPTTGRATGHRCHRPAPAPAPASGVPSRCPRPVAARLLHAPSNAGARATLLAPPRLGIVWRNCDAWLPTDLPVRAPPCDGACERGPRRWRAPHNHASHTAAHAEPATEPATQCRGPSTVMGPRHCTTAPPHGT